MIELSSKSETRGPKIMVVGVGGGGNNAVSRMIESGIKGVDFGVVNTDLQVLEGTKCETILQIGKKITAGYGAGADPEIGEAAANESSEEIEEMVKGNDLVIITAGMGGGTGTGAAPIIARICKDCGILTVAVVTTPFTFESLPRVNAAMSGVEKLKEIVDTLLVIPNDKLLYLSDKSLEVEDAFLVADSVLKYTIEGITNIVYNRGIVNLDFNDLRATLKGKGLGHLGIGTVNADECVIDAVKMAINSPLLDTSIEGATNLLVNSSGRVSIVALNEAISYIREIAGDNVNIIWGNVKSEDFDYDKIVVTIIATGMPEQDIPSPPVNKVIAQMGAAPTSVYQAGVNQRAMRAGGNYRGAQAAVGQGAGGTYVGQSAARQYTNQPGTGQATVQYTTQSAVGQPVAQYTTQPAAGQSVVGQSVAGQPVAQSANSQYGENHAFNPQYQPGSAGKQANAPYLKPRVENIEIVIPDFLKNR